MVVTSSSSRSSPQPSNTIRSRRRNCSCSRYYNHFRYCCSYVCRPYHCFSGCFILVYLLVLILGVLPVLTGYSRHGEYLYHNAMDTKDYYPIIEYVSPLALAKEEAAKNNNTNDVKTTTTSFDNNHPDFLYHTNYTNHRIVEFYAPWCPHCRRFKQKYIDFAREMTEYIATTAKHSQEKGNDEGIDFYAVSCVANKKLCRNQNITGYPTVKIYFSKSIDSMTMEKSKLTRAYTLKLIRNHENDNDKKEENSTNMTFLDNEKQEQFKKDIIHDLLTTQNNDNNNNRISNVINAATGMTAGTSTRTKEELFNDAYLSFVFSIRNGIYMLEEDDSGSLSNKRQSILCNWLELLKSVLPLKWYKMHTIIGELLNNFDRIVQNETNLEQVIDNFEQRQQQKENRYDLFSNEKGQNEEWSYHCTKGEKGMGFTCGLWTLFHIVSIGVVEWNTDVMHMGIARTTTNNNHNSNNSEGIDDIPTSTASASNGNPNSVTTSATNDNNNDMIYHRIDDVGNLFRNFIENFFGCEVCRTNFLNEYDTCANNRCKRLLVKDDDYKLHYNNHENNNDDFNKKQKQHFIQFPLWLFEMHNDVNIRLYKEKYNINDNVTTTGSKVDKEIDNVQWPSKLRCPKCWLQNGQFSESFVYEFLKREYWLEGEALISGGSAGSVRTTHHIINDKRELLMKEKSHYQDKHPDGSDKIYYYYYYANRNNDNEIEQFYPEEKKINHFLVILFISGIFFVIKYCLDKSRQQRLMHRMYKKN